MGKLEFLGGIDTKTNGSSAIVIARCTTPTTNIEVPTKFVGGGASTPRKIYTEYRTYKSKFGNINPSMYRLRTVRSCYNVLQVLLCKDENHLKAGVLWG